MIDSMERAAHLVLGDVAPIPVATVHLVVLVVLAVTEVVAVVEVVAPGTVGKSAVVATVAKCLHSIRPDDRSGWCACSGRTAMP